MEAKICRNSAMDPEQHRILMQLYAAQQADKQVMQFTSRELEALHRLYTFLPEDRESSDWQMRMIKRYHDSLFKEYCLADLSQCNQQNGYRIALRWRLEGEVQSGKGQFICGNLVCSRSTVGTEGCSWEVNFAYLEHCQKKNALVKLRLCSSCSRVFSKRHQ